MEKIKVGLLGVIAITLVVNTVITANKDSIDQGRLVSRMAPAQNNDASAMNMPNQPNQANPEISPVVESEPVGPLTSIGFKETEHSFGTIKQDSENRKVFTFTNTGAEPLIISQAKGSCGCTVPKYPTEPIAPGGTGEIEVVYKPGKQKGNQQKTVTVTANTEPAQTILNISAEVQEI